MTTAREYPPQDALPYIDEEYNDPQMQAVVQQLVKEEMRRFTPPDYLESCPALEKFELKFKDGSFLKEELDRVAKGNPIKQLDVSRYKLERPSGKDESSLKKWQQARDNAQAQLEHQHTRIMNLELMSKYGTNAWRKHNEALVGTKKYMESLLQTEREEVEKINSKRKMDQVKQQLTITTQQQKYYETIHQNMQLEVACASLERDLKKVKAEAEEAGVLKSATADSPTAMEE